MKYCSLSSAIRAGSALGPQAFDRWFGKNGATCALGAARVAEFGLEHEGGIDLGAIWPYCITAYASCPDGGCSEYGKVRIFGLVVHLNDFHRWTRDQIADWLESEEEKLGYITLVESEKARTPVLAAKAERAARG
jgi:hypothetical protein